MTSSSDSESSTTSVAPPKPSLWKYLSAGWFTADLRALAAMRIGLGLCALYEFLARIPVLRLIYGGVDAALPPASGAPWSLGLLWGSHPYWLAWLVLVCGMGAALHFIVGRWTRLAQGILILTLLSFHAPIFEITLSGGSTVLRQVLIIALFFPLSRRWAWDAELNSSSSNTETHGCRVWLFPVLILQLAIIYVVTALNKDGPSWVNGSALLDTMTLETRVTWFGRWFRSVLTSDIGVLMTNAVLLLELVAPIFLLLPLEGGRLRRWTAIGLIGFHLGIAAMLDVAHFSWVMIAVLLVFMGPPVTPHASVSQEDQPRFAVQGVMAMILVWLCVIPALKANGVTSRAMRLSGIGADPVTQGISQVLLWEQQWGMFSPSVPRMEFLLIVRAQTQSGVLVDPYTGSVPHQGIFDDYPSTLYESFTDRFRGTDAASHAVAFRRWVLDDWNTQQNDPVDTAEVVLLQQVIYRADEGKASRFKETVLAGP